MKKYWKIILFVCILTTLIVAKIAVGNTNDEQEIKKTISDLTKLEQTIPVLPPPYNDSDNPIPEKIKSGKKQMLERELRELISASSPLLASHINILNVAIESNNDEFRATAGGVRWIKFFDINIEDNAATVKCQIRKWAKMANLKPKKGLTSPAFDKPENTMEFIYTLVKENGKWKVTGWDGDFLPGEHP